MRLLLIFLISFSLFSADDSSNAEIALNPILIFDSDEAITSFVTNNIIIVNRIGFNFTAEFPQEALGARIEYFLYPFTNAEALSCTKKACGAQKAEGVIKTELEEMRLPLKLSIPSLSPAQMYVFEIKVSKGDHSSIFRRFIVFSSPNNPQVPEQTWGQELFTYLVHEYPLAWNPKNFTVNNFLPTTASSEKYVSSPEAPTDASVICPRSPTHLTLEEVIEASIKKETKVFVYAKNKRLAEASEAILGKIGKNRFIKVKLPEGIKADARILLQRQNDNLTITDALALKKSETGRSLRKLLVKSEEEFEFIICKKSGNFSDQKYLLKIEILGPDNSIIHRFEHEIVLMGHNYESNKNPAHLRKVAKILEKERKKFKRD